MEEEDSRGPGPAENRPESPGADVTDDEDDGFSFPVPPLAADACIVPVYPIFGRSPSLPPPGAEDQDEPETATVRVPLGRLLLEEREFRARQKDGRSKRVLRQEEEEDEEGRAGGDEELEGVPPESYCLWAPGGQSAPASPRRCRKSGSTGSVLRWRRISERLVGRSHSDGMEKFMFLTAPGVGLPPNTSKEEEEGGGSSKGDGGGAGHQLRYYGRGGGGRICRTSKSLSGCSPMSAGCAEAITRFDALPPCRPYDLARLLSVHTGYAVLYTMY